MVFDLDGTLADTVADLIFAANATFGASGYGRPLDPASDPAVTRLGGGRAMLMHGYAVLGIHRSDAELEKEYQTLIRKYSQRVCVESRLYPGCMAALERLHRRGVPMAVCTNKPGVLAHPLLEALGVRPLFGAVIAADTLAVRKPHPEPLVEAVARVNAEITKSVLIGDSVTDRETARAAGALSVMVTFGPLGHDTASLDPHALLHHFDELDDMLAALPARDSCL